MLKDVEKGTKNKVVGYNRKKEESLKPEEKMGQITDIGFH